MAVYVVSDLHGAADALDEQIPKGVTLLLLGDLINFIDYFSMTGILTEVFSVATVAEVVRLRTAGDLDQASRVMRQRASGREDEIRAEIGRRVREAYEHVFARLPDPTYLILGNVDNPGVVSALLDGYPHVRAPDGSVVTLGGERFGFIGGALPTPMHVAGEITEDEMRAKVDNLGPCDVLCSHIPPAIPELCFDTIARKPERGSRELLDYIMDVKPRRAYFGHLHQPLISAMRVGPTLCVNVGYFRATRRAWEHTPADESN